VWLQGALCCALRADHFDRREVLLLFVRWHYCWRFAVCIGIELVCCTRHTRLIVSFHVWCCLLRCVFNEISRLRNTSCCLGLSEAKWALHQLRGTQVVPANKTSCYLLLLLVLAVIVDVAKMGEDVRAGCGLVKSILRVHQLWLVCQLACQST